MILYENQIKSSFKEVDKCVRSILILMGNHKSLSDESILFKVSFVLRELMNNSVEHGNHFDISKLITCKIYYEVPNLIIEISDEGNGFKQDNRYNNLNFDKRERRRGLKLIEDLNFKVEIYESTIKLQTNVL